MLSIQSPLFVVFALTSAFLIVATHGAKIWGVDIDAPAKESWAIQRWIGKSTSILDIKLYQYGMEGTESGMMRQAAAYLNLTKTDRELVYNENEEVNKAAFPKWESKQIVIIIPDASESGNTPCIRNIINAYKNLNTTTKNKYKIILVDWLSLAAGTDNHEKVAMLVGCFCYYLETSIGVPYANLHIIGNGAATDIAAYASDYLRGVIMSEPEAKMLAKLHTADGKAVDPLLDSQQIGRITGLNPVRVSKVTFQWTSAVKKKVAYLEKTDAVNVDIVYTSNRPLPGENCRTCHMEIVVDHGLLRFGVKEEVFEQRAAMYYAASLLSGMPLYKYTKDTYEISGAPEDITFGSGVFPSAPTSYYVSVIDPEGIAHGKPGFPTIQTAVIPSHIYKELTAA